MLLKDLEAVSYITFREREDSAFEITHKEQSEELCHLGIEYQDDIQSVADGSDVISICKDVTFGMT